MTRLVALARAEFAIFLHWWFAQLASSVPCRVRQVARRDRRRLVVTFSRNKTVVLEHTPEGEHVLGEAGTDEPDQNALLSVLVRQAKHRKRPVTLRLRADLGLRKLLDLPLAAKDDLHQLLRLEMDRLTPFRADEVCFAWQVRHTRMQDRRITVELYVAPKPVIEQALSVARELDIVPARVELDSAGTKSEELPNLLPSEPAETTSRGRQNRGLALLAVTLAALGVAIPLARQHATEADLAEQVTAARGQAEISLALREQLDQQTRSAQFLLIEKTRSPLTGEVLAELTRLIPDQAHLVQLQVRDGTVELHGFASAASTLISLLDQSPLFRAPQFRSPVTQDSRTGAERFHLSIELASAEGS